MTNLSAFGGILLTRYPEQLPKRLPAWVRHAIAGIRKDLVGREDTTP